MPRDRILHAKPNSYLICNLDKSGKQKLFHWVCRYVDGDGTIRHFQPGQPINRTPPLRYSSIYRLVSSIKRSLARKTFSSAPKPRPSENSNPIAPHTRFHASARARPGFPCAPRNAPRRKGGPAEMAMARWPMAALLSSVTPIGRHPSDVTPCKRRKNFCRRKKRWTRKP